MPTTTSPLYSRPFPSSPTASRTSSSTEPHPRSLFAASFSASASTKRPKSLLEPQHNSTKSPPSDRAHRWPTISILVICLSRELASQAAAEATKLLKYHPTIGVQVVIGGTRLALEHKRMQENPCHILVATPGRLRDHTKNTASFATRLIGVRVLVLDERNPRGLEH
ncbi:hypothetical protein JHK87_040244 [Glycine soja]|nr:hypothetical protein JHK87_040244 [Glycine soja]